MIGKSSATVEGIAATSNRLPQSAHSSESLERARRPAPATRRTPGRGDPGVVGLPEDPLADLEFAVVRFRCIDPPGRAFGQELDGDGFGWRARLVAQQMNVVAAAVDERLAGTINS